MESHCGIRCHYCGKTNFKGMRVKCAECPNYEICSNCYALLKVAPGVIVHGIGNRIVRKWRHDVQFIHLGSSASARCNVCKKTAEQIREKVTEGVVMFTCYDGCPNYDICKFCHRKNLTSGNHKRSHRLKVTAYIKPEEAIIARQKAEIAELRAALEFLLKNQLSSNTLNLDQLLAKGF